MRVVTDLYGAASNQLCLSVARSTVSISLLPSRKRFVYGLMAAIATVLPLGLKRGAAGEERGGCEYRGLARTEIQ